MTTELAPPKGHGLVRVGHNLRIDVPAPLWQSVPGTDYWLVAGSADPVTASGATNLSGLDSFGWTTTTMGFTNTVTADFMSSADDTPPIFQGADAGDILRSPLIFGNYSHRLLVGQKLGYLPTRLMVEFYGAFTTATADESTTHMGLHNGSAIVGAIYADGTNFQLSNGVTTDAGAVVDNSYHQWRLQANSADSLFTWWIDGTSQGTLAITQDVWPAGFQATAVAAGTNRFALSWLHIWYE